MKAPVFYEHFTPDESAGKIDLSVSLCDLRASVVNVF